MVDLPLVLIGDNDKENCFNLEINILFYFRSTGTLNKHHGKQKISFSRKFPFMKSRERLNKLDDEDSYENGSNHR